MRMRGASPDRPSDVQHAVLRRVARSRRGGTTIEYGLILAFIVLMIFGALQALAGTTTDLWTDIATRVTTAR